MHSLLISFIVSFLATAALTPGVILLARKLGWVARPREDRWHSRPTALMGGIAIFFGASVAWLTTGDLGLAARLILPAGVVFLLGFIDDRMGLRPHHKLIGQLAAGAILVRLGITFDALPQVFALPLTLFWLLAITNAINLLDNMDGLAAGVVAISALAMAAYSAAGGQETAASAALALTGACSGFLLYNFNPARVFMGDCGSMFLGFSLAALALQGTHRSAPNLALSLLVPVSLLAIPIFDTTLVSVARTLHGRSISQGGRDHSSHRLVALGLSERGTVLVLYLLTATFGGLALAARQLPILVVGVLAALLSIGLGVLGLYLGLLRVYKAEARVPERFRKLGGILLFKRQLFQVLLDVLLVPLALVSAYLLRFEGNLPAPIHNALLSTLPLMLVAKLLGLSLCRAYRGVWRCAGAVDALAALAGSATGSLLIAVTLGLWTGFRDMSRAALIIDWMLFTMLVLGSRMGYVLLRELFGLLPAPGGTRVLILGSGAGILPLIGSLRDPHGPRRATVVGIIDDNPGRRGRSMNGVPVVGRLTELPELVEAKSVQCCLLGVPPASQSGERIQEFCREHGIPLYRDLDTPLLNGS